MKSEEEVVKELRRMSLRDVRYRLRDIEIDEQAASLIESIRARLNAVEKELVDAKTKLVTAHMELKQANEANAELVKVLQGAQTTLQKLGSITDENRIGWTLQAIDAAIQKGQE